MSTGMRQRRSRGESLHGAWQCVCDHCGDRLRPCRGWVRSSNQSGRSRGTGRQPKWPARVLTASIRQLPSTARPPCAATIVTTSAASSAPSTLTRRNTPRSDDMDDQFGTHRAAKFLKDTYVSRGQLHPPLPYSSTQHCVDQLIRLYPTRKWGGLFRDASY